MRLTHPERSCARGITLIELIVAMVLIGIIVAATVYFFYPVAQSVDVAGRARLTDTADNALQRIGREVRLALPNSIRTATFGNREFVEFLPLRTAGRYRGGGGGASSGTDCPDIGGVGTPASDQLSFDGIVDTCFKTIGELPGVGAAITETTNDWLVFNNYGEGFAGQSAYATAGTLNRRLISAVALDGSRARIAFTSATALDRTLHDSVGKRFFVAIGNATTGLPEAVTYECNRDTGQLLRRWGYTMVQTPTSPPTFAGVGATSAEIARDVTGCNFDYQPNGVGANIGLLTVRLTLSRTLSESVQTVSLYHAIHVNNLP
jgi:MSHA biogenesis protein MshO